MRRSNEPAPRKDSGDPPASIAHPLLDTPRRQAVATTRLLELIDHVRDIAQTRKHPVSNITDHGLFLLFDHELEGIDARIGATGKDTEDEVWLSVPRSPGPSLPPRPRSAWLAPWLAAGDGVLVAPRLLPWIEGSALIASGTHGQVGQAGEGTSSSDASMVRPDERIELDCYAFRSEVEREHQAYLDDDWMPWSLAERQRRRLARLYVRLFTLYQQLSGSLVEDPVELVLGMGISVVETDGAPAAYPILTRAVDLRLDGQTGALEIRPRDETARVDLDFYARLDPHGHAQAAAQRAEEMARAAIAQLDSPASPFESATYLPVLAAVRAALTMDDAVWKERADQRESRPGLRVTNGWALFARPRSADALDDDLEQFRVRLQADDLELPAPIAALVGASSPSDAAPALPNFRGISAPFHQRGMELDSEPMDLYFPSPFNEEQLRVAQLLEQHDAVVVQGPPGTGKTHTIANIICHCLATGRRVLVTSMAEPALAVLQEKLPEAIQPLALSLHASAHEGVGRLEISLRHIAATIQSIDPAVLSNEALELEGSIDGLHARLTRIDTEVGRWARLNQMRIDIDADTLSPMDAAQEVMDHRGEYEWLPDPLGIGPQYTPRFAEEDVARLRAARRRLGDDIEHAGCELPAPREFPEAGALLTLHQGLAAFARLSADVREERISARADADETLRDIVHLIDEIERLRQALSTVSAERSRALRRAAADDAFGLLQAFANTLEGLHADRMSFLSRPVEVPARAPHESALRDAIGKLGQGRRAFSLLGGLRRSDIRRQLAGVRIDARPPACAADWEHVAEYLTWRQRVEAAAARWNALATLTGLPLVASEHPEQVLDLGAQIRQVRTARTLTETESRLVESTCAAFPAWSDARRVSEDAGAFLQLQRALMRQQAAKQMAEAWAAKSRLRSALEGRAGPVVDLARAFLADVLGNPAVDERLLLDRYARLTGELLRLQALSEDLRVVADVTGRIALSGAGRYAERLRRPYREAGDALLPDNWRAAWRWRSLATHLALIDPQDEFKRQTRLRADLESDLARAYGELTVKRVWLRLAEQLTAQVRAGLQAYLNAVQHLGNSSGRRNARYRRDARLAATIAQAAVPCWIMPHHRVCETLPAQIGMFDLVVVDEASQSDLSALPVLLRGRKWLIVGDDKQVSPERLGVEEIRIEALMHRHLRNQLPLHRAQMSADRSLYDLAKVAFAGSCVALKEHFRCVEPIIAYARREFYHGELHPLRLALPAERLEPALVDVLIAPAQRKGDVNAAEARCIADEVKRLTADPAMGGRTIGIISLLGDEQALRIWETLNDELGSELLQRFGIVCGDARAFQGRERDVVFLSMVSAPNDPGAPLAGEAFAQRFNVATSRARDRMVLVRSVDLRHLHPGDRLRRSLIEHFTASHAAAADSRDLRLRCESPLERELFDWLKMRGYRIVPQAQVGNRRIDLVVEGVGQARLAIECDGDKHHGPDKWTHDVRWQRILERLGWTVWRCFASSLVRRRESVFSELERTLSSLGIAPTQAGAIFRHPAADAGDGVKWQ